MDARLKQRLIGAAVLLALLVIVVPMFFSGHEQGGSGTTSVSLAIPAQPQPAMQTRTLELGAPTTVTSAAAAAVAPTSSSPASATSAAQVVPGHAGSGRLATVVLPAAPPDASAAGALPRPAPGLRGANAGGSASTSTNTAPATPSPVTAPAAPSAPSPAPTRAAAAASPLPAGTAAQTSYQVNLGFYAAAGNARALAARVRKLGFEVHTQSQQWNGQAVTRVLVGPFANRALAESARLRIRAAEPRVAVSVQAQHETLGADAPASALPAGQPGGWVVQLGAFDQRAAADALVQRSRAAGFPAFMDTLKLENGSTLWRVRVGPEASREGALGLQGQLQSRLGINGIIAVAH